MIFKVQLSMMTTEPHRQALIYNRERSLRWQGNASQDMLDLMDGDLRAFFHGRMDGTVIVLDRRCADQDW